MSTTYEIGPFRLDAAAKAVTHAGAPVALGPRAVAVLALLVESASEYVPKARLMDEAWPGVVVEEANLAVQISAIRRALGRAPGGEQWIETLTRRGYRFVGPVNKLAERDIANTRRRSNLPDPLTSFVGRERELAELRDVLGDQRLLTLVGAGGVGKTRLALHVAVAVMDAYRDGVWLVELAALSDAGLVPHSVASALGLKEQRGKTPAERLTEYLEGKRLLLVLDNAEHLLGACAELIETILRECSQITWLVTSRERLGVHGEVIYRVPSLSVPDARRETTAPSLLEYESVRLFGERVRLHRPHFAITDQNASAVTSICRRLDGIPLAIELAAARVPSMAVEEIDRRLRHGFNLLTGGSRTTLVRQQTLRAAIDWSYDLLNDAEQALFRRLSVFAGGWTLAAAEQVCADERVDQEAMLDLLTSLADKSLVSAEERDCATRYRLLETVRQYARERLRQGAEEAHWRDRHLAYFLALAEEAAPLLRGADQQDWLERLETEHDNIRLAMEWAKSATGDAVSGLRLAGAISWFWEVRGHLDEGRRGLSSLLAVTLDTEAVGVRAKALQGAGQLALRQGDFPAAESLLRESLAIKRQLGDRRGASLALRGLGIVAYERGDYSAARELQEESLAIQRDLGDRVSVGTTLNNLGNVAVQLGDYASARRLFEESLAVHRDLEDRLGMSLAMNNLGWVACAQDDHSTARVLHQESLAMSRELGDRRSVAVALNNLGRVASIEGNHGEALPLLKESLVIRRELGDRWGIPWSLEELACVAFHLGAAGRAACIWGSAERLREEISAPLPPGDKAHYERCVAFGAISHERRLGVRFCLARGPGDDARAGDRVRAGRIERLTVSSRRKPFYFPLHADTHPACVCGIHPRSRAPAHWTAPERGRREQDRPMTIR